MSREQLAFIAIDRGTATVAASLIVRIAGRWRLAAATAAPASIPDDAVVGRLRTRLVAADPDLATWLDLADEGATADLPPIVSITTRPPEMAVVAATERVLAPLAAIAAAAGWRIRPLVLDGAEILPVATALADPRVTVVLAGASEPPGADERALLPDLGAIVAAATERRPDLVTVLAGGLAEPGGRTEQLFRPDRPGPTVLAPSPASGDGEPLRDLLDSLRGGELDGHRSLAAATGTLAEVMGRRVEVLDIGQAAGVRVAAAPIVGHAPAVRAATVASAALLPPAFTDANLDEIMAWLTVPVDRLRARDRLREMALVPWGDAAGEGAQLRLAAAKAAVVRLLAATPRFEAGPGPDLLVATGGAWQVAPGPAVALALADTVRRPGIRAMGWDHARLLAPLGTIEDPDERRAVIADLRDDLLAPLGSVLVAGDLRSGRTTGTMTVRAMANAGSVDEAATVDLDLVAGGLELVDLPPGERAEVEVRFRDAVDLGPRVRHASALVTGGLAGMLVDLRGVPMVLPDRLDERRELLASWQAPLWPGADE